jgi:signal transduction histidine kinase
MKGIEYSMIKKLDNISNMFSLAISDPLWDYDRTAINSLGDSMFKDSEVVSVTVYDDLSGVVYESKLEDSKFDDFNLYDITSKVQCQMKSIGKVEIVITSYYQKEILKNTIYNVIFLSTALILIIIVFIIFISNRVTHPIRMLKNDAFLLSEGKPLENFNNYPENEIGVLADAFYDMADKIKESKQELVELNSSLEMRVQERTKELEEKNDELIKISEINLTARLVNGVAHEINTPLGVAITISSYNHMIISKMIKRLEGDSSYGVENLRKDINSCFENSTVLENNLQRVSKLVNTFKELSFKDAWKKETKFSIKNQIMSILSCIPNSSELMNEVITFECSDDVTITGHVGAYYQIINQLVENALVHGIKDVPGGKIYVKCESINGDLLISVKDNGNGIDNEHIKDIFSPFYKEVITSEGIGLGLTIVENIVKLKLHGEIMCESKINEGTTFIIKIPIS